MSDSAAHSCMDSGAGGEESESEVIVRIVAHVTYSHV